MEKLSNVIAKNGKLFFRLQRKTGNDGRDYAVYQVLMVNAVDELEVVGFETIRIMERPACTVKGIDLPAHEGYPGDNEFGKNGWYYRTRALAEGKYQELLAAGPSERMVRAAAKKQPAAPEQAPVPTKKRLLKKRPKS